MFEFALPVKLIHCEASSTFTGSTMSSLQACDVRMRIRSPHPANRSCQASLSDRAPDAQHGSRHMGLSAPRELHLPCHAVCATPGR